MKRRKQGLNFNTNDPEGHNPAPTPLSGMGGKGQGKWPEGSEAGEPAQNPLPTPLSGTRGRDSGGRLNPLTEVSDSQSGEGAIPSLTDNRKRLFSQREGEVLADGNSQAEPERQRGRHSNATLNTEYSGQRTCTPMQTKLN